MSDAIVIRIHNPRPYDTLFRLRAHWGGLPDGARVVIGLAAVAPGKTPAAAEMRKLLPEEIDAGCGHKVKIEPSHVYEIKPNERRQSELPEIRVKARGAAFAAVHVSGVKVAEGTRPRLNLLQMEGNRVAGGFTIEVRKSVD